MPMRSNALTPGVDIASESSEDRAEEETVVKGAPF
jgi:hypothetical protein